MADTEKSDSSNAMHVSDVNIDVTKDSVNVLNEVESTAEKSVQFLQAVKMKPTSSEANGMKPEGMQCSPGPLPSKGISFHDLHHNLEQLIIESDENAGEGSSSAMTRLDDIGKAAVVSHSFGAYMSLLDSKQQKKLSAAIVSDTSLWICRLLRFFDATAFFHEDSREGLVRICRMLLYVKYPKFATDGYEALYSRPPVIYVSAACKPILGQYICTQLGLPLACLTIVPCNTHFGSHYKLDIAALERLLQEDLSAARIPLILVANAGTPLVGQVDTLHRLQELCKLHDMWLHVEGHSLASLCLVALPNLPARIGDSLTLPLGLWLGVPSLPCVTLYKTVDAAANYTSGLSSLNLQVRLNCIPLWTVLQMLGHDGVVHRIKHCFELTEHFLTKIEDNPRIRIVGKERLKSKEGQTYSVANVISKAVSTTLLFDILVPVVVFHYIDEDKNPAITTVDIEEFEDRKPVKNAPYFDNLNSWLGQVLMRDVSTVHLDIVELDQHGLTIRFSPLETAHAMGTTIEDINDLANCLEQQLAILNATVKQKSIFSQLIQDHKNIQLVEIKNWAGLGAVRYIPIMWVGRLNELTDSGKEELKKLNAELVAKLKSTDSAFSLGEGDDGMLCVRFGMVTDDLDTEELLSLVLTNGKEVEESAKFLESMSEMIKLGIQEANKGLVQENMEKIMQDGILRHVPLVGNFVNWWSPPTKESGIKGRSFNLSSGVVESTEKIYKYHMQIQENSSPKDNESHSRTSSLSSHHDTPGIKTPDGASASP